MAWRRHRRLALVALGKEAECVDLPNEISDASPSSEPETHNEYPNHDEGVDRIHGHPTPHEGRRLLGRILHHKLYVNFN